MQFVIRLTTTSKIILFKITDVNGVFALFQFIYGIANQNYKVGSKPEEEIPRIMKAIGYPFLISKSSMFTVGSPHTWPSMLAALSFMVDWINVSTVIEPRCEKTGLRGF